jgi:hypothetical protein
LPQSASLLRNDNSQAQEPSSMDYFPTSDFLTAEYAELADTAENTSTYPLPQRHPRLIDV